MSSSSNNNKDIINSKSELSSSYDDVDSSLLTVTLTSPEYCCSDTEQQNIKYENLDLSSKKKCKPAIDESANKCYVTNKSDDYIDYNEVKENVQEDCYNYKSFEKKFAGNNSDLNSTFYSYSTSSPSSSFRRSKNNNESCITNDLENKQYDDAISLNSCNLFSDIRKTDDCSSSSNSSHVIADSNNCSTFASSSSSISAAITLATITDATTITKSNNKSKKSLSLSLSAKNQKENHHHKNFISKLPSGTSRGFENTFRILENQISTNHKKNLYLRRISEEYIPSLSSLMHDDNDDNNRTGNISCSNNYDVINNITGGGDEYEDASEDYDCVGAGAASISNSTLNKNFSTHTRTLPSTSSYYNSNEYGTEDSFNFLELELEAIKRLQQLNASYTTEITTTNNSSSSNSILLKKRLNKNNNGDTSSNESITSTTTQATSSTRIKTDNDNNASVITSPINEILYGFNPNCCSSELTGTSIINVNNDDDNEDQHNTKNCKIIEENILEESITDYPECIYHIARGKDGRKYLRVVRSLLLDKVLCGNRVSQMTRAYDDIEAVTRLLEEKEKDLELTVQIGKELLTQNNRLENRINELENELKSANEDRSQLLHDLHQKNELIVILTNDVDDGDGGENDTPTLSKSITLDLLQRKIQSLQDENKSLKQEALQLAKQTDEVEEQERQLMENITVQLNSANSQFDGLNLELERLKEENRLQHEQIISLTARLSETEMRLHQLTTENDEQGSLLSITKENQNMLASELTEFKTRYQEVLALLQEAQEQLRKYRKKTQPHARNSFISNLGIPQPDSLHSELMESSMYSENSLDSGISTDRISGILGGIGMTNPQYKRVFETVKCAAKSSHYSDGMSHLGAMALSSSSQPRMTPMPYIPPSLGLGTDASSSSSSNLQNRPSSVYSGSNFPSFESSSLGVKTMSCESLISQNSEDTYPTNQTGVPGVPGAKDLEAALKRLTSAEVLARRAMLSHAPAGTYSYEENYNTAPLGLRTPDSIMSTGSSGISNGSNQWRLPEKLQIVKPMEGSQTLHHWSRLATPTLSGLLEERPGVTIRGGRGLEDLGLQIYSLSDVEEDVEEYPGKQFQSSACVYTYTNSTVMHPDDGTQPLTFLSQSQLSSRMASASTSRQPSCPPTPRANLSRRNSCSTFSVNMGLASMLSERGIKAVTPSALNTPLGPNFSPTVTPCNSPEGSPTRSMSPEPLFGILSSGADLLRRKLIGNTEPSVSVRQQQSQNKQQKIILSRLEKRALRSLRLLEKVENMGLENIIATHPSAVSQLSSGIASRSASPMAQLTSLKNLHPFSQQQLATGVASTSISGSEDIQFYHNQLKYRLNTNIPSDLSDDSGTSSLSSTNSSCNFSSNNSGDKSRTTNQTLQQQENAQTSSVRTSTSAQNQRNNVDETTSAATATAAAAAAASDIRIKQMQRQKSRRNLKNGIGGQRPDLGTVGGRIRPDLGVVDTSTTSDKFGAGRERKTTTTTTSDQTSSSSLSGSGSTSAEGTVTQSLTQSFVGSISSLFFGRKGGWL